MQPALMVVSGMGLLMILAGCTASTEKQVAPSTTMATVGQFTDTDGGVEGRVMSDDLIPISNASVEVPELVLIAFTDGEGRFAFSFVPPGVYRVMFQAHGFLPGAEAVEVRAGVAVRLDLTLSQAPSNTSRIEHRHFEGLWGCSYHLGASFANCDSVDNPATGYQRSRADYQVSEGLSAILFELTWRAQSPHTQPQRASIDIWTKEKSNETWASHGGVKERPVVRLVALVGGPALDKRYPNVPVELDGVRFVTQPDGPFDLAGTDAGIVYQQRFQVYTSLFYHMDPPGDYTSLPDG